MTSDNAMVAEIKGIGNPTGAIDPPQNGWCSNKTGSTSGTTQGCIWAYPQIFTVPWLNGQPAVFDDIFFATNSPQLGDSGALWLDNDRRVHGMMFASTVDGVGYMHSVYQRWAHVQWGWNVGINTAP
ncbi:MAG: hypothetical protein C4294_20340 [Nitrospiraceae bacterium]